MKITLGNSTFASKIMFGSSAASLKFQNFLVSDSPLTLNDPFNGTDKMITDAGLARSGRKESYLNLSGTSSAGEVEIEYLDHGDSNIWKPLEVTWDGSNWTATDVPFTAAPVEPSQWNKDSDPSHTNHLWWNVAIREVDNPFAVVSSTNRFRPGVVVSSLSQSEREHIWLTHEALQGAATVVNAEKLQVLGYDMGESEGWFIGPDPQEWTNRQKHYEVNSSNYNDENNDLVTTPVVAMSNLFNRLVPDYPILFVDNQWQGTSRSQLGDNNISGRTWAALEKQIEWLSDRNSYVGIQDEMWWNSDRSLNSSWAAFLCPLYTRQYKDGSEYLLGDKVTDSDTIPGLSLDVRFNNCFFDLNVAPNEFGDGIYRQDRTVISWMGVNTFNAWTFGGGGANNIPPNNMILNHDSVNRGDQINKNSEYYYSSEQGAQSGAVSEYNAVFRRLRQALGEVFDDSTTNFIPLKSVVKAWTFETSLCLYGDYLTDEDKYSDMTHPAKGGSVPNDDTFGFEVNGFHGNILTAKHIALSVAKCIQISGGEEVVPTPLPVPSLAVHGVSNGGRTIVFKAVDENGNDLPDGYELSTYRQAAVGTIDAGTAKDLNNTNASELHTAVDALDNLEPEYRRIPQVLGFDVIPANLITNATEANYNVVVSDNVASINTPNTETGWDNHLGVGYSATFADGKITLEFDNAPTEDYCIRYGWGSIPVTSQQFGIHDKHYMNMPIVTVKKDEEGSLFDYTEDGTNDEVGGLQGCSLDNVVGLPVSDYPRTPIWLVDISENTATKQNNHSFLKLNRENVNSGVVERGSIAPSAWTEFNETDYGDDGYNGDTKGNLIGTRFDVKPVARFITQPVTEHREGDGSLDVDLLVHPYNGVDENGDPLGIEKVEFYLNNGNPLTLTGTQDITDTATGEVEKVYRCTIPAPELGTPEISELRAIVYPTKGRIRVLQGSQFYRASQGEEKFGLRSKDEDFAALSFLEENITKNGPLPYFWSVDDDDVDDTDNDSPLISSTLQDFGITQIDVTYGPNHPTDNTNIVTFTFDTPSDRDTWYNMYRTTMYGEALCSRSPDLLTDVATGDSVTLTWTNGFATAVAAEFASKYVFDSKQTLTVGYNTPVPFSGGYWSAERGVMLQKTSDTVYHISPTGNDSNAGTTASSPLKTPAEAYSREGSNSNFVIDNSAYSAVATALCWDEFFAYYSQSLDAWDGHKALPVVRGGVVLGLPSTGGSVTPITAHGSVEAEKILNGAIFDGCKIRCRDENDTRLNNEPGEDLQYTAQATNINGNSEQNSAIRVMLRNCDIGPENFADLENQVGHPTGGSADVYGIYLELKGTGDNSNVWSTNSTLRYSHFKRLQESIGDRFVCANATDLANCNFIMNCHVKDVAVTNWPIGPVGGSVGANPNDAFCPDGGFGTYVNLVPDVVGFDTINKQYVDDKIDEFFALLANDANDGINSDLFTTGTSPDRKYILKNLQTLQDDLNAISSGTGDAKVQDLKDKWNAIPEVNNIVNPVAYSLTKKSLAPYVERITIDISNMTDPDQWAITSGGGTPNYNGWFQTDTNLVGAVDPHVDIVQAYWDSQFRIPNESGAFEEDLTTTTFLSNTIVCNYIIEGNDNEYQGVFYSDGAAVKESGLWNLEWNRPEYVPSSMITTQFGHVGQQYGGLGTHYGPNVRAFNNDAAAADAASGIEGSDIAVRFRDLLSPNDDDSIPGNFYVYDVEGKRWNTSAGGISQMFVDYPDPAPPSSVPYTLTADNSAGREAIYWSDTLGDPEVPLGSFTISWQTGPEISGLLQAEVVGLDGGGSLSTDASEIVANPDGSPIYVTDDAGRVGRYGSTGRLGANEALIGKLSAGIYFGPGERSGTVSADYTRGSTTVVVTQGAIVENVAVDSTGSGIYQGLTYVDTGTTKWPPDPDTGIGSMAEWTLSQGPSANRDIFVRAIIYNGSDMSDIKKTYKSRLSDFNGFQGGYNASGWGKPGWISATEAGQTGDGSDQLLFAGDYIKIEYFYVPK